MALVDIGATHNFVSTRETVKLGLKLSKDDNKLKVVNKKAQETHNLAKYVVVQLRNWKGTVNFFSVPLDDFDFVLGNDFFQRAKIEFLPHLDGIFIMDETQTCYVHGMNKQPKKLSKKGIISTLQVEKGLRNGQLTYNIALIEIKPKKMVEVFYEIMSIL